MPPVISVTRMVNATCGSMRSSKPWKSSKKIKVDWINDCWLWLYRGPGRNGKWKISIWRYLFLRKNSCVNGKPFSNINHKRQAIIPRVWCKRVLAKGRGSQSGTASMYNKLGLAEMKPSKPSKDIIIDEKINPNPVYCDEPLELRSGIFYWSLPRNDH